MDWLPRFLRWSGLSAEQLAASMFVHPSTVHRWASGGSRLDPLHRVLLEGLRGRRPKDAARIGACLRDQLNQAGRLGALSVLVDLARGSDPP